MAAISSDHVGSERLLKCKYLVKGLKLPHCEAESPAVQLLLPYFTAAENFIFLASSCTEALDACLYILDALKGKRCALVSENAVSHPASVTKDAILNVDDYDHIIFFNTRPSQISGGPQISIFLDYASLPGACPAGTKFFDATDNLWYRKAIAAAGTVLPGQHTLICKAPKPQTVRFEFATSENLKQLALSQLPSGESTVVYTQNREKTANIPFKSIDKLHGNLGISTLILWDVPSEDDIEYALNRVENIIFLYTTDDFVKLAGICAILDRRSMETPKHIRNIVATSK